MFGFIFSFFRKFEPELSLEEASRILRQNTQADDESNVFSKKRRNSTKQDYNFSTKSGKITSKKENEYIIDELYKFTSEEDEYQIEDFVCYQILIAEGKIDIYNVYKINNEWDMVVEKDSLVSTRVMVCQVEKREKRTVTLFPGDIKVNLDKVAIEFIPYIGDWVEIDVKYEINEEAIDLSGKIVEVNRISPMRPHIESDKISLWDPLEENGIIGQKIYFDKSSLSYGYVPVKGDLVVAQIIESEHSDKCKWRALKVLPELVNNKFQALTNKAPVEENHPGLEISVCPLIFDKLGITQPFTINITNNSDDIFELLNIELSRNSQISVPELFSKRISPKTCLEIDSTCTGKTMGTCNEFIEFHFKGFSVGKCVNVTVNSKERKQYYQPNNSYNYQNAYKGDKQVIRGQTNNMPRFRMGQIPQYPIPKHLLDLTIKYETIKEKLGLIEELKLVKKCLFTDLNPMNYEDRFHTLLHMEEIANLLHIRQYDQDRACFIPNQEFLMLEIENLAERRPSIVLGDRIMASNPLGTSEQEYEGNVFKVGAKHVYLKFSSSFHECYRGEDYTIRVIPGRASYKRQHHAIYLATRNLGRSWLFPDKIAEKELQLKFIYHSYPKVFNERSELNDGLCLDQDGKPVTEETSKRLKIDWYNKRLNCKQKDAVINILKGVARPLPYIIFGPPGTGKTVTVIESILQVLRLIPSCRILVTAPSNSASDLIALRLIDSGVLKPGDLVRLVSINYATGENIPPKLVPYCATASQSCEGTGLDNVVAQNGMTFDCSREVLGRHKVTVSTCSSSGLFCNMGFPRGHFTHIFVDEAGQAAEPEVLIPLTFMDKQTGQVVLAGDPMQLGPVITSSLAKECGLSESFLERLINRFPYIKDIQGFPDSEGYDPRFVTKLLFNYRSLSPILNLFSDLFYHGDLIPTISDKGSAESELLDSLAEILPKLPDNRVPAIVFHGVEGENYQTPDSPSWYNPHEVAQVFYYINEFLRLGLRAENIGVITPYTKQVREIRQVLREAEFPLPKVGTVEEFQGQEFDVILLSTVRSSRDYIASDVQYSLGFVSSPRRLNVAISRPKCLLVIIGNPKLLGQDSYWRTVISYCMSKGAYTGCC